MLPVFVLVGRSNVGKSTLFNKLTMTRDALVDDQPGVTRDRLYGRGKHGNKAFLVVDTGGIEKAYGDFSLSIKAQVEFVLEEAQAVFFLVDARQGLVGQDQEIADLLRKRNLPVYVLVNKSEGINKHISTAEFQELAMHHVLAVSAKRGDGVEKLLETVLHDYPETTIDETESKPKFAIVGRPNVGKSTLTNKLVGEHRMIISDIAGTTRDSVQIPLMVDGVEMTLIDTAGVRRKSKVDEVIEKYSVIKTLQAIENCNVAVLVLSAHETLSAQDALIAGMVDKFGKSIVIVINKWDGLERHQKTNFTKVMEEKLAFLSNPEVVAISALHGSNVNKVLPACFRAFDSATTELVTSSLNQVLQDAIMRTPPPMYKQRSVKLKFAHQAGKNPLVVVVHGNQVNALSSSYKRFLARFIAHAYKLKGTPVRIIPRVSKNPFANKNKKGH